MTLCFKISFKCNSFSRSDSINLFIGIPVHLAITSLIVSTVTFSWSKASSDSFDWKAVISLWIWGNVSYLILEASSRFPSVSYLSFNASNFTFWSFKSLIWSNAFFSSFHWSLSPIIFSSKEAIRPFISFKRFSLSSFWSSFSIEIRSISRRFFSLVITSNSSGKESISIRTDAQASSIRSIALSGKKRSVI